MKKLHIISLIILSIFMISCNKDTSLEQSIVDEEEEVTLPNTQFGFEGAGTEPFWAFRYTGGNLTWQVPGDDGVISSSMAGQASLDDNTQQITIIAGDFTGVLTPETCSDGMSDNVYPYSLVVQKADQTLNGCAREYVQ